ncbi:MAG: FtsH protease activity modulator HflK [Verrucomicrobia bacterium]|nr:FtsH protease activity modulator HflK [Verrucomicrobiota bacterium]
MTERIELPANWQYLKWRFNKFASSLGWLIILGGLGLWLSTGVYTVGPYEVGLVKRFGKFSKSTGPGFHYRLPSPIESVALVDQRSVRTEEIGFRSRAGVPSTQYSAREEEALMLTGDFNIIRLESIVQYDVTEPETFAFQVENHRRLIREAAQAVIREKVALHKVDEALTEKREEIANQIQKELQELLKKYGTGLRIINVRLQEVTPPTKQVAGAFDDVNSALQDKERLIFEAQRYTNEQTPRAEGQAQKILNEAEGYKQSRILAAQGDVARFAAVLDRYKHGEDVTRTRLYIETMESILPGLAKVIVSKEANGTLKLLNLGEFVQPKGAPARK